MINGFGIPKMSPPPIHRKDWYSSPNIEIGRPCVMMRAKLLAIERVASVGTKGDILRRVMQSPFMIPMPEAPSRLIRIARGTGHPCVRRKATMTAVIPQTDPTDKSMPPVRMTRVIPIATIPTKEKFRVMFVMFWISKLWNKDGQNQKHQPKCTEDPDLTRKPESSLRYCLFWMGRSHRFGTHLGYRNVN